MPPLWQYFALMSQRGDQPICAPKGTDPRTLQHFPCKVGDFWGTAGGAMIAFTDPLGAPTQLSWLGANSHVPVGAVLLACANAQNAPPWLLRVSVALVTPTTLTAA